MDDSLPSISQTQGYIGAQLEKCEAQKVGKTCYVLRVYWNPFLQCQIVTAVDKNCANSYEKVLTATRISMKNTSVDQSN